MKIEEYDRKVVSVYQQGNPEPVWGPCEIDTYTVNNVGNGILDIELRYIIEMDENGYAEPIMVIDKVVGAGLCLVFEDYLS